MRRKNEIVILKEKLQRLIENRENFQAQLSLGSEKYLAEESAIEAAINHINVTIENISRQIRDKMDAMI